GLRTVSQLPEDAPIAVAVGRERDAAAVRRPYGIAILSAEGQTPQRSATPEVVDRDDRVAAQVGLDGELAAVRRHGRKKVGLRGKIELLPRSVTRHQRDGALHRAT